MIAIENSWRKNDDQIYFILNKYLWIGYHGDLSDDEYLIFELCEVFI